MKVAINNNSGVDVDEDLFVVIVESAEKVLESRINQLDLGSQAQIDLLITDDEVVAHYNKKYRGKDSSTDVLSFSYLEGVIMPGEDELIGEVIISAPWAQRQSEERGVKFEEEMQFLFTHGLLHVLGFDHETEDDRKEMFDLTDEIIGKKLPPYPEERE